MSRTLKLISINDSLNDVHVAQLFYPCGQLMTTSITKPRNGPTENKTFYENGRLISHDFMNAGKQELIAYYPDGKVMEQYTYIDNTLYLVCELKLFYPNGQIKVQQFFEDSD